MILMHYCLVISISVVQESCYNENYVGDMDCDELNNHKDCHYDGGDCCLEALWGICQPYCLCHAFNGTFSLSVSAN